MSGSCLTPMRIDTGGGVPGLVTRIKKPMEPGVSGGATAKCPIVESVALNAITRSNSDPVICIPSKKLPSGCNVALLSVTSIFASCNAEISCSPSTAGGWRNVRYRSIRRREYCDRLILEWRENDGWPAAITPDPTYVLPPFPGLWQPTPPANSLW
jgi:hypothetical protein